MSCVLNWETSLLYIQGEEENEPGIKGCVCVCWGGFILVRSEVY